MGLVRRMFRAKLERLLEFVTLILDALKGAAAVLVANAVVRDCPLVESAESLETLQQANYWWVTAAAVAVIVGHMFPVWLRL